MGAPATRTAPALVALALLAGWPSGADASIQARVVTRASPRVGERFAGDCSGFVLDVFRRAGVSLRLRAARSRSESLHLATARVRQPRPGDLAFFHDTYDRDRDGRANDRFTHVAIVERVEGRRVTLVHVLGRSVVRTRMDLSRPSDRGANDPVRARRRGDAAGTRYLAGELFAGYGSLR
jgi:hypothetical protein